MATTTKAKEDDDHDKQMTSTIPLPPQTTTTTTTTTTATTTPKPPTSPNKLKDLPPPVQDRQSSGGDESTVSSLSSTSFNPTEQSTSTLFLPLSNSSASKSLSSFVLPDNEFPPEVGNADIFVARDGSFVETSSGAAARELKKRYDERFGVGSSAKGSYSISPYAITAFVNQHGKQMYRVGHRELSPPGLSREDAFIPSRSSQSTGTTKSSASSGPTKRRSRMSMHTFLPPTIFKSSHNNALPKVPFPNFIPHPPPHLPQQPAILPVQDPSSQQANNSADALQNRRLRKARSLSNMFGMANAQNPHIGVVPSNPPPQVVQGPTIPNHVLGRPHAHSVTGADMPRSTLPHSEAVSTITTGIASMDSISSRIHQSLSPPPPAKDVFSDIMGWNAETLSETDSFDDSSNYGSGHGGFGWRPDVNVSGSAASSSSHNQGRSRSQRGPGVKNPFGRGIHYDPPVVRERGRGRERSWGSGRALQLDVDGHGSLGLDMGGGTGEAWDADEVGGYRYTDHLKVNDGPVIREMQSFESGLTARADPISRQSIGVKGKERRRLSIKTSKPIPESEAELDPAIVNAAVDGYDSSGSSSPGSAFPPSTPVPSKQTLSTHIRTSSMSAPVQVPSQEAQSPSLETSSHSRYSTRVFDVLQSYRGLPLLDKLSEDDECTETTVIRLSARSELSAAPKDDPRFVMWGEVWGRFGPSEEDGTSVDVNASVGGISKLTGSVIGAESASNRGSMVVQGSNDQTLSSKKGKKGSISLAGPGTQPALTVPTASLTTLSAASLATSTHSLPIRTPGPRADGSPPISRVQPPPSSHLGHSLNGEAPRKVLIAATIERWIAQLTSELNYDELLIFFLTYRTYVSAVDLCHLLICRFHWALESPSSSPPSGAGSVRSSYRLSSNPDVGTGHGFGNNLTVKDAPDNNDMVKRIVRVRTFIAIRYWLLTFFAIDFVPNRELRVLFGNWLNTLAKDPTLHGKKDIMDIVRKLKKVAKDCIGIQKSKPRASGLSQPRVSSSRRTSNNHTRKSDPSGGADEDSDVDLDFLPDSGATPITHSQQFSATGKGPGVSPPSAADAAILQQPLHLALLSHSQSPELASSASSATLRPHNGVFVPSPSTLPFHHKPLSRAFTNTIGRLGRWKRVLNHRSAAGPGGTSQIHVTPLDPLDVSPFNLEPNATGDLLRVKGGVEQYFRMIDQQSHPSSTTSSIHSSSVRSSSHPSSPNMISPSISLPGTPGVSAKDIGTLCGGGIVTNVPSATPVSPSVSNGGDRDGTERLGVVSEEPEDQDEAEAPSCASVDESLTLAPSEDTQGAPSPVPDIGDEVWVEVQEVADADVEAEEDVPAEENAPDRAEDTTPHPIDFLAERTSLRLDSRPASPESYDSEKSRRQAHESLMSGPQPEISASSPPQSTSGPPGGRGLTRGGYHHRFQHNSWDIPDNGQVPGGSWQIDVVSIDELDLSDMSSSEDDCDAGKHGPGPSDPSCPPGLRRLPKKLPLRREFQFLRPESVSSFSAAGGRTSVISAVSSSIASSNATDDAESNRHTTASGAEDDEQPRLGRSIHQWQVNAIVDSLSDEEEGGDVEAALNRLEGRINQTQRVVKQSKVETWVKSIRERMANGLYGDDKPRFPVDDSDEDDGTNEIVDEFGVVKSPQPVDATERNSMQRISVDIRRASQSSSANDEISPEMETPMAQTYSSKATANAIQSGPGSPVMGADSIPAIEDVVPLEILQSRVATRPGPSTGPGVGSPASGRIRSLPQQMPMLPRKPHRSFVLTVRARPLAEHFAVIERELFVGLKFEELVVDDWKNSVEESNILDWAQFLKDRARYKAEGRITAKTSALVAFRGRFNLFAKFVASEIVMTLPGERLNLVSKFIRVAWKLYERGAFNTLISLLAGLKSDWVTRALGKRWDKLGSSEARVFRDLKLVTDAAGDFRYLRQEVEAAVEAKPISVNPRDSSAVGVDGSPMGKGKGEGKIQPRTACIPFLGQYLSQLYRHCQLPDLIDPTAPNAPVCIDPETNTFEPPAHPEVFAALAPLPPLMQLEPLINIQKQRRIAGVIKSLVTGQHLASKLQYPVDKKLFQRCLRLKALDDDTLYRVFSMYAD